jgi:hypothetical protein
MLLPRIVYCVPPPSLLLCPPPPSFPEDIIAAFRNFRRIVKRNFIYGFPYMSSTSGSHYSQMQRCTSVKIIKFYLKHNGNYFFYKLMY